jgi:hypothetical protein
MRLVKVKKMHQIYNNIKGAVALADLEVVVWEDDLDWEAASRRVGEVGRRLSWDVESAG